MKRPKFEDYVYPFETKHNQYEKALNDYIDGLLKENKILNGSMNYIIEEVCKIAQEKQVLEKALELTCDNLTDYFDCDTCPVHQVKEEDEYCMVIMSCEKILAQYYKNKAKEELESEVE